MKLKHTLRVTALIGAWTLSTAWAEPLALISNAEAQLPNAKPVTTRAITRGPGIKLVSPADVNAGSFSLKIAFEPRGGAKIDPQSVHVEYLKEPVVDLTPRLSAGLKGDQIDLPQVSVPKGTHTLRVSAKDSEGRSTATVISLNAQ
jgi:hypothetical protein